VFEIPGVPGTGDAGVHAASTRLPELLAGRDAEIAALREPPAPERAVAPEARHLLQQHNNDSDPLRTRLTSPTQIEIVTRTLAIG
jgi:hypothetical protein